MVEPGTPEDVSNKSGLSGGTVYGAAALVAGILLAALQAAPLLPAVVREGLHWPICFAGSEATSLSTYGKWGPHAWLPTDGFSGDLPAFYNYVSDALLNRVAGLAGWPPMTVQAVLYGPLLGCLLLWLAYLSLNAVVRDGRVALLASVLISLGGDSGLVTLLGGERAAKLEALLHVPLQTIALGTSQSLGWVLFLPCLCLMHLAYEDFNRRRALAFGALTGLLFHVHTLTFANVGLVQLLYLVLRNGVERPRDARWKAWVLSLGALVVAFGYRVLAGTTFSSSFFAGSAAAALLATFLVDPAKAFYAWGYGAAAVVVAPYALALAPYVGLLPQGQGPSAGAVGVADLLLFFAVYWMGTAFAALRFRERGVRLWTGAMLLGTLLLALNHHWGWANHPYRFAINLIFPLGILASLGIVHGPRRPARVLALWIGVLVAFNSWNLAQGRRLHARVRIGSPIEAQFLRNVTRETTAAAGSGARILNPPEFEYPKGVLQSAVLLNYSRIPGFVPDYRYLLWKERYFNRMGVFCFLFPGYPNHDAHLNRRACEDRLDPPPEVMEILDPRLRATVTPLYSVRYAGATGMPFDELLEAAERAYGWTRLAAGGKRRLLATNPPLLPGVAPLEAGRYGPGGFSVGFGSTEPGRHLVLLGGRKLSARALQVLVDGREVNCGYRSDNWAAATVDLAASRHQLELPWTRPAYEQDADYLYFVGIIHERWVGRYLRLPAGLMAAR